MRLCPQGPCTCVGALGVGEGSVNVGTRGGRRPCVSREGLGLALETCVRRNDGAGRTACEMRVNGRAEQGGVWGN